MFRIFLKIILLNLWWDYKIILLKKEFDYKHKSIQGEKGILFIEVPYKLYYI